jgi:hypothetical protein
MLHSRPEQQSAVVVQSPALGTQTSSHLPLTQGLPQQSALVEQIEPAGTPASVQRKFTPRQRGMPSASREQHSSGLLLHVPFGVLPPSGRRLSQQLLEVPPHAPLGALQTAPGRRHCGPSQRPSVSPAGMMHWSGGLVLPFDAWPVSWPGPPQQSLLAAQSSSCGLQPEGGWQTFTPVVPNGPHESEQHLLSQPCPVHTVPDGEQDAVPTVVQRPSASEPCFTQLPPQQSTSIAQTSPVCWQNDAFTHFPPAHCCEQQSPFPPHALPSTRQPPPPASATHVGPVPVAPHLPLQHSAFAVQASAVGVSVLHTVGAH